MNEIEVVLLLLVIVAALTPLARKLRVPYPILLVLGGLILALLPILPTIPLEPELVFLLFLPPLIYSAAITTPLRDLKVRGQHILSLAVGLVLATTLVVALLTEQVYLFASAVANPVFPSSVVGAFHPATPAAT